MKKIFGILILTLVIWACSSSDGEQDEGPTTTSFDRGQMLEHWADNIIIPSLQSFSQSLSNLETAFNTFNADRNEANLIILRNEWRDAYLSWQRVSLFEIGPSEAIDYRLNINSYPTSTSEIESNILNPNVDLALPSNRDAKGFPAIDYLINGSAESDSAILARFTSANEGEAILSYLEALITDMSSLTSQVLQAWQGEFRDQFVTNDGSSVTASVDLYVNDYIFYYERFLRAGKMGIPAGVFSNTPLPENLEALYDGSITNDLFLEGLDAVQNFFNGIAFNGNSNGISLDNYLEDLGRDDLVDIINNQYNIARIAVSNLNAFQVELENNPPIAMLQAYEEVQRVVPLIKVDMLSVLNINVDFQDADGD